MTRCECGSEIVQSQGRGRRRTKCEECSPARKRPGLRAPVIDLASRKAEQKPEQLSADVSLTDSTRSTLTDAGRLETWQGAAALTAAKLVDAGQYTAQGAAALLKAHREALGLALEGAGSEADVIDLIFGAEA